VDPPETKYVAVGNADVAYQVFGDGPDDLLYLYGVGSHVELQWDLPSYVDLFGRLGSLARVIRFDRRGTGASDGVTRTATRPGRTGPTRCEPCSTLRARSA
jgi:pimeloyl-ACP methyl ester carboxylesterase